MLPKFAAPGVFAHLGQIADLDFLPDHSVDFAFSRNVLEHLTQSEFAAVLAELRRVLKPGGTLNILEPN